MFHIQHQIRENELCDHDQKLGEDEQQDDERERLQGFLSLGWKHHQSKDCKDSLTSCHVNQILPLFEQDFSDSEKKQIRAVIQERKALSSRETLTNEFKEPRGEEDMFLVSLADKFHETDPKVLDLGQQFVPLSFKLLKLKLLNPWFSE